MSKQRLIRIAVFIVAALVARNFLPDKGQDAPQSDQAVVQKSGGLELKENLDFRSTIKAEKVNGFDKLVGVKMVDHRNNDGDSFFVDYQGKEFELRLYFVDTPEKYLSDRYADQRDRVAAQAKYFDISVDDAVKVGQDAKNHVAKILAGKPFTVFTKWERVYDGERYYGFVQLPGSENFLTEELMVHGLGRIHTKGNSLPNGKESRAFKRDLQNLEQIAKKDREGAWGLQ